MMSSISGDACMAAMVCSMIGLPAILISCLGMFSPTRVPVPPARTTATLRRVATGRPYRRRAGSVGTPTPFGSGPADPDTGPLVVPTHGGEEEPMGALRGVEHLVA